MEHLRCVVERITYQNADNGYTVLKCAVKNYSDLVTVVGTMPDTHVGSVLSLEGMWKMDAKYGRQFLVEKFEETLPATVYGIEKYLGSGLVKGVGPKFAKRIVEKFGKDTLDVIEETPDELLKVSGIGKVRVDRIKTSWQEQKEEQENQGIVLIKEPEDTATVPKFLEAKEEKSGAVKGTAMHHVMQRLDFTAADTVRQVEAQLLELQKKKQISEEEISLLNIPAIVHFFRTDIGKRAADAARRGQLYREKQFVIGVPASDIRPQWDKEEMVLVQGIIDAWFYEGDQIVLLDYKTDRVLKGQEQKLKERYQAQLDYYAKALKQTTGHEVKEKIIYAFSLQEGIAL